MTQSINSTIADALNTIGVNPEHYPSYVEAVEKALTEREYQITDELLSIASQYGSFDEQDVKNELAERTGLSFRPVVVPEPVEVEVEIELSAEEVVDGGKSKGKNGKRIDSLEDKIDSLTATVNKLAQLAQRHLGASI